MSSLDPHDKLNRLTKAAMDEYEYHQMRRDYAEKLGVTVEEMEAYERSIVVLSNLGHVATNKDAEIAKMIKERLE